MVLEMWSNFVGTIFIPLTRMGAIYTIGGVALIISFIFALFYKIFVNQEKMRKIKDEMIEVKEKMTEAKKKGNDKELKKLVERSLEVNKEQMILSMKPLFISMIFAISLFVWLRQEYTEMVFNLPISLPYFGNDIGWLGFYIIISLPSTFIFRKILEVD